MRGPRHRRTVRTARSLRLEQLEPRLAFNAAPTEMALSADFVSENQPAGTVVGEFTTVDPDAGDVFSYALVAGAGDTDNASFSLDGGLLRTAVTFDHEAQGSRQIRVRSTDSGNAVVEVAFTIEVRNAAPVGSVGITGFAIVGATLAATHSLVDLDGFGSVSWQWSADGVPIGAATGETYALTAADVGTVVTVAAAHTDGQGSTETVVSRPTDTIASLASMRDVIVAEGSALTETQLKAGFLHGDGGVIYVSFDSSMTPTLERWWLEVLADVDAIIEPEFAVVPASSSLSQLTIYQLPTQSTSSGSAGVYIGPSATIWDDGRVERTSEARLELALSATSHSIRFGDSDEAGWKSVAYHELGHAIGFEHSHESDDGDVNADIDTNTTVMSYVQVVDADGDPGFTWLDEQAAIHIHGAETGATASPAEGQLVLDMGPFGIEQTWKTPSLRMAFEDGNVVAEPETGTVVKRLALTRYDGFVGSEATVFLDWDFATDLYWGYQSESPAWYQDVLLSEPYPSQVVFAADQVTAYVDITIVGDDRVEGEEWLEVTARESRTPGYFQGFPDETLRLVISENYEPPAVAPIADLLVLGDGTEQVVSLTGIQAGSSPVGGGVQAVQVTAVSSDTAVVPTPVGSYTASSGVGSLIFTPGTTQPGTVVMTVTLTSGGLDGDLNTPGDNSVATETFAVTVLKVLPDQGDLPLAKDEADRLYVNTTPVLLNGEHAEVNLAGWQAVGAEATAQGNYLRVGRGTEARVLTDETWAIMSLFHSLTGLIPEVLDRLSRGSHHAIAVTVESGNYAMLGSLNPTLTVYRGTTFTFAVDAPGQPLHLQTTSGGYDAAASYTTGVSSEGTESGMIVWEIAADAPAELFYQSETDPLVWGAIIVADLPTA